MKRNKHILFFCIIIVMFYIQGCGYWTDFTTYFNLYYNMKDIFDETEQMIQEEIVDPFAPYEPTLKGQVTQNLNKVIEKCSEILQWHDESSFVDNALFILGKSFYYQKNYLKATRKFSELLATQEESDLALMTRVWIAKSEIKLRNYTRGMEILEAVRRDAEEEENEEVLRELYIEGIKYFILMDEYNEAIDYAHEFITYSDDDEMNALTMYKIGDLNMELGNYEAAAEAFNKVEEYSPTFEVEFEAKIHYAHALRLVERADEAKTILLKMDSEAKYSDVQNIIDLELGKTYRVLKDYDAAYDRFYDIDTSAVVTQETGNARFEMGEMFETDLLQYDSAAVYYEKAKSSQVSEQYIVPVQHKYEIFSEFAKVRSEYNDYQRQEFYYFNPEIFAQDSAYFVEEMKKRNREQELANLFTNQNQQLDSSYVDSLLILSILSDSLLMDTLYVDSLFADSLKYDSLKTIAYEVRADSLAKMEQMNQNTGRERDFTNSQSNQNKDEELEELIEPKKPRVSIDSLYSIMAQKAFDIGNIFFTEIDAPDSAFYYYDLILQSYPNTRYHPEVLYTTASYFETIGDSVMADSFYAYIYRNYQDLEMVNSVAAKIDAPLIDFDYDPAESVFISAEEKMLQGDYDSSIDILYTIYKDYPESQFAAKSLYTYGWILEEELELKDSAAAIYDSLKANYPQSDYAKDIGPKLQVYKNEIAKIEKARQDSLKAIEDSIKAVQDSIRNIAVQDSLRQIAMQDSIAALSDTTAIIADSLSQDDSLGVNDSIMVSDSVGAVDSLQQNTEESDSTKSQNPNRRDVEFRPVAEKPPQFEFRDVRFYLFTLLS